MIRSKPRMKIMILNKFINLFENSKMSIISSKSGKSKEGFIPYQS